MARLRRIIHRQNIPQKEARQSGFDLREMVKFYVAASPFAVHFSVHLQTAISPP